MKKIKTFNKLLSSLTLLSPLAGIGFNNQYQNTQKVLSENTKNYLNTTEETEEQMGDVKVKVQTDTELGKRIITDYVPGSGSGRLIVSDDINEIDSYAFQSGANITSLDLSNATKLTTIGTGAFDGHKELTGNITIPSSVTSIGAQAFSETDITSLDLSQATNLTTIGDNAFAWSDFINSFKPTPKSNKNFSLVTNLGPEANVLIPGSTGIWNNNSMSSGSLAFGHIILPKDITSIADSSFSGTGITSLDLSQATSLTTIGSGAFNSCLKLTGDLVIPSSVTSIETSAFYKDKITSLDLSQATSLTTIGNSAFYSCLNLTGDLVIPSSVTSIGSSAFASTKITSLDLSNATKLTTIGSQAFESCSNLTGDLVIPSSVTSIQFFSFINVKIDNLYFLSETPPSFTGSWKPTVVDKVYVPQGTKDAYSSKSNFGFDSSQVVEWSFDSSSANISGDFSEINISNTDIGNSNSFSVSGCNPEILSDYIFTWSLVPTGETQSIPKGLSISKGIVNWNNVPEGTYTFKIQSSFDTWTKQSDQTITINVTYTPIPTNSNTGLILGLVFGLGIPILLVVGFGIWYFIKKKKTTVKI